MTAQTRSRIRSGFDSVSSHEVAPVNEATVDSFRLAFLDGHAASLNMAVGAPGFSVALRADRLLARRAEPMRLDPTAVVAHERFGPQATQALRAVTGSALGLFEVGLMAVQARIHRRQAGRGGRAVDHASVAAHTLAVYLRQLEVIVV
jgi:hypothetical protein